MGMSRPLTRNQALQNRAFLKLLRKTANVRLACRELGLKYGTMQDRRRKHPGFAVRWDAAVVFAQAELARKYARGPSTSCAGPPPSAGIPPNESVRRSLEARSAHRSAAGRRGEGVQDPSTAFDAVPLTRRFAPPSPARGKGLSHRTLGGEPQL